MCESISFYFYSLMKMEKITTSTQHTLHTKEGTNLININLCVFRIMVNFISMKIMKLLRIMVCKQHCSGLWNSTVSHSQTWGLTSPFSLCHFFIIHLFTCAYIVWVISPSCPILFTMKISAMFLNNWLT
jgi:hypothetical protein